MSASQPGSRTPSKVGPDRLRLAEQIRRARLFDSAIAGDVQGALDLLTGVLESSTEYSIVGMDLEGRILLWNEGARRLYGYEPEEVIGKANSSMLHAPEDVGAGKPGEIMAAALRDGKWEGTLDRVRKNGRPFSARVVITPRRDANGTAVGFLLISKDISEELKLIEYWERTFDSVPDLIAILDEHFHIVRANRAMAKRLGLAPEQCVGQVCYECVHQAGRPPDFCPHARTMSDGQEHVSEVHEKNLGGYFLVSTTPLLDAQGRRIGSVHVARDITERKRSEEALRESEERFRNLAEGLPELVWVSDAGGKATYLNPQVRAYAGAELGSVEAWMQLIHPEDLPRVAEAWRETIRTASDFQAEHRLRRHDGHYRWFLTRCVVRRASSGEIEGWIGTSTDIHDQKQAEEVLEQRVRGRTAELQASEERFRQLAENIHEVFWMLEPDTRRLLYVSPAYDAIWGRARQELYERPESFLDTIHPEDRPRVLEILPARWQAFDAEFRILRPDGMPRWIRLCSFPVYNDDGEVYRLAGVAADRTEQKAAEAALIQAERLTIAGKIAASLAHEINSPLQAAIGCLDLAKEALEIGGDTASYLQIAHQALQRTARIVTQLRSMGRPIQEGQREPTDLNSLLNDVLALNKKRLQSHHVEVAWEPGANLPLLAVMPDGIHQVFLNLVMNAVDAMPEGGQLRLSTKACDSPAGVRVVVSDTGSGIPLDSAPHIFDAFYSTKSHGLGVGLFVSQSIVQQHGGRIDVESRPGEGSTFTVWLPA